MGSSKSVSELAEKFIRAGRAIETSNTQGVAKAALEVKLSVQRHLQSVAPRGRLNVGKRGQRVSVGYDLKPGVHPIAVVRMKGPAHLLESDTRPHDIPKSGGKKKLVVIPGVGPRAHAHHPGTKGRHPWAKGVAEAIPHVRTAFMRGVETNLRKIF